MNPSEKPRNIDGDVENDTAISSSLVSGVTSFNPSGPTQPSEEEIRDCRHVKNKLPWRVYFVALLGLAERFAYYGIIVMFQNYIQNSRDDPLRPGALGLGQSIASLMNNLFTLYSQITPTCAAIIADSSLGRFRTLCLSLFIYLVGLMILIFTSLPTSLAHNAGLPGLIVTMVIVGVAVGGVKATIGPFMADQCVDEPYIIAHTKSGEKVIVDREATLEYIFNIYYWCVNVGALAGIGTTFMEKEIDFWAAFLMPSGVFAVGVVIFVLNNHRYVDHRPPKNVLPAAFQACWYGIRGGGKMKAAQPDKILEKHGKTVSWNSAFIEELQSGLMACRAFIFFIIYWLCQTQMSTNLISQAAEMEGHGIPNDLLPTLNSVAVVVFLPVLQHVVNPFLRKLRLPFPPVKRMLVGFTVEAAAMAYVAGIQKLIYSRGPCFSRPRHCTASQNGQVPNKVHVLAQLPVYILEGIGEAFSNPAGYEYAYTKAPVSMKTVVQATFQLSSAGGSGLSLALTPTYKDPDVLVTYASLAGCMFLNALLFYALHRKHNHRRKT